MGRTLGWLVSSIVCAAMLQGCPRPAIERAVLDRYWLTFKAGAAAPYRAPINCGR